GSLRFGQGPLARLVPDLVTRQPAPGGLHGEDAGEARGVPAAGCARAALPPQAEGLPLQQVRTVVERRQGPRLRRERRIARNEARLHFVDVVPRFETVAQHQRVVDARQADLERLVASLVVALDDRKLDAQQTSLPGLAVEKTHGSPDSPLAALHRMQ